VQVRRCCGCGKTHPLTMFGIRGYTTADGTRKTYRRKECNPCRQFKRNGGRPSKPKIALSQTLVQVEGKTCKQCTTCRETKKLEAFCKTKNAPTGFAHKCRKCSSEYKRKDYAMRPETRIAKRAWDARNAEKVREQEKIRHQRYNAKPEVRARHIEYSKQRRLKNPEQAKATSKKRAEELTDAYVTQLLCAGPGGKRIPKSKWPAIPIGLVQAKRAQLKLIHKIKGKG